jgi:hypothetical protein
VNKYGQPTSEDDYIAFRHRQDFIKEVLKPGVKLPIYDEKGNRTGYWMSGETGCKEFHETTAKMWQSDYAKEKNLREMREYTDMIAREEREVNFDTNDSRGRGGNFNYDG